MYLNGSQFASVCDQCGISGSGSRRPDSSSSARNQTWKIAPTRVVQNVTIPSENSFNERITYAPQMATRNTTISSAFGCSVGWKMSDSATAIGRYRMSHGIFWPANDARS